MIIVYWKQNLTDKIKIKLKPERSTIINKLASKSIIVIRINTKSPVIMKQIIIIYLHTVILSLINQKQLYIIGMPLLTNVVCYPKDMLYQI